ncbi:hypothetical protein HBH64_214810 [Parastagonospora nodorum]|nr:hypothetical protein HBI02_217300 [Parastagonospora nodorum]KAH4292277.1 hypothetical protein HBI01_183140 [Parastagonospora nodorum]KAH4356619.1 hypothetical protein HBH94_226470 [Parastagonospora nodorum]KAH4445225.1 hypothetical protein HBH90_214380 [Parastagonospora nodorum]KAH4479382.1 hypothetical protein HBH88_190470 [Parastagonospora nodorum]
MTTNTITKRNRTSSPLLHLTQELHDQIYGYLHYTSFLTKEEGPLPRMLLQAEIPLPRPQRPRAQSGVPAAARRSGSAVIDIQCRRRGRRNPFQHGGDAAPPAGCHLGELDQKAPDKIATWKWRLLERRLIR